jgi:hypothetical protein
MKRIGFFALAFVAALQSVGASSRRQIINRNTEINAKSQLGQHLLQHARRVNEEEGEARSLNENEVDYSFVADYSIKFQGCHHVQQWNADADEEDDVRVKTKRLVRFRLCESDSCSNTNSAGCTSKFGDYVVDMNTFVAAYLEAMVEEQEEICGDAAYDCQAECDGNDDQSSCMSACYDAYDLSFCNNVYNDDQQQQNNNNNNGGDADFDASAYAECARLEGGRRRLDQNNGYEYYIGPYCADQGGEIHLGLFTDDTCTTYAQNGESTFYNMMGYSLPFSDDSLVSSRCFSCGQNNGNGYNELKDFCANIYDYSGKCETRMDIGYPNESSCSYIEGIKIIREDGVIRTSTVKKSKAAAVCIGLFLTLAVLLAGYVYYLRTSKLFYLLSLVSFFVCNIANLFYSVLLFSTGPREILLQYCTQ